MTDNLPNNLWRLRCRVVEIRLPARERAPHMVVLAFIEKAHKEGGEDKTHRVEASCWSRGMVDDLQPGDIIIAEGTVRGFTSPGKDGKPDWHRPQLTMEFVQPIKRAAAQVPTDPPRAPSAVPPPKPESVPEPPTRTPPFPEPPPIEPGTPEDDIPF